MTENTMDVVPLVVDQSVVASQTIAFLDEPARPFETPQLSETPGSSELSEPSEPSGPDPLEPFEVREQHEWEVPVLPSDPVVLAQPQASPSGPAQQVPVAWQYSMSGNIFAPEQEPLADGGLYTAVDGGVYFRPTWRVGDRPPGLLAGPDVWFDRDEDGAIRLRWRLTQVRPAGAPPEARSLLVGVESVTLRWNGGSRTVERPAAEPDLAIVLPLLPDDARAVELAMSDAASGCRVEVAHTVHYRVPFPVQPRVPLLAVVPNWQPALATLFMEQGREMHSVTLEHTDHVADYWVLPVAEGELDWFRQRLAADGLPWWSQAELSRVRPALVQVLGEDRFQQLVGDPPPPSEREEYAPVRLSVPFVFNPNDDANRPIYRALHGLANLTDDWRKSGAGWLRASPFPNTVYRLPDEVRLGFDPDLGTPHVVTTLHTGDDGRASVRVLLRVAPWQDPRRVVEVRELVGEASARVIVGPVPGATLRLGGSFPDGIRVLGGADGVPIPLDEGADLLMDLTLEYFQLLSELLGGAVGLPGAVEVRLTDTETVSVPVSLRMDRVDDLPVGVETLGPTSVRVTNRAGTAIRASGCHAMFLRLDGAGVVPLAAYPARCTTPFPLELPTGGAAELAFEATEPRPDAAWNAVLVELLDKEMVDDARTVLTRAQQLAGSGELTWDLTVSTPVFAAAELPARWATLASIEVEVSAPGFETTTVVLRRDTPSRTLSMRRPLVALVAGGAAGIRTASYRVRNNHVDHQGPWSQPQQQSGEELVVFPNQALV